MSWYYYSIISIVSISLVNILTKKVSSKADTYTIAWVRNAFALPVLWLALYLAGAPTVINNSFWLIISFMLPFEVIIGLIYYKGIQLSPISLTIPITSFSPVFIAIGTHFILHETINLQIVFALFFLILGSYVMGIEKNNLKSLLQPIISLLNQKGVRLVFIVCIIWGFTIPLGKLASIESSPQYFAAIYNTLFVLLFTPIFLLKSRNPLQSIKSNFNNLLLIGLLNGIFLVTLWLAISSGSTALVNAFGTLAVPLTVILAGTFLQEGSILKRIIATSIMTIGAIIAVYQG